MYKLTILLFCLITFSSLSLTDSYQLKFENKDATYTLQIKENRLVFEDNQPNVSVIELNNPSTDKDINAYGKIYRITKESTFEEGLKIGGDDEVSFKIGGDDEVNGFIIGEDDEVAGDRIGADDTAGYKEINSLFGVKEQQAYEIMLGYELVTIVEKSSKFTKEFPIEEELYLIVSDGKFGLFK